MSLPSKILAGVIALLSAFGMGYWYGEDTAKARCEKEKQAAVAKAVAETASKQVTIVKTVERWRVKKEKQKVAAASNIARVEQYAPTSLPPLPGSFRLLHDAAAQGVEAPDPARTDAPSVAVKAVAATVTGNYAACLYDQSRLEALQEVVKVLNGE